LNVSQSAAVNSSHTTVGHSFASNFSQSHEQPKSNMSHGVSVKFWRNGVLGYDVFRVSMSGPKISSAARISALVIGQFSDDMNEVFGAGAIQSLFGDYEDCQ
jgi:hypothetical protein